MDGVVGTKYSTKIDNYIVTRLRELDITMFCFQMRKVQMWRKGEGISK